MRTSSCMRGKNTYVYVYACENRVWVDVPALCGALNRGPFVVERDRGRERERERETDRQTEGEKKRD